MKKNTEVTVLRANSDLVAEDKNARSLSFFCKHPPPILSNGQLKHDLKNIAKERNETCVRFCLHTHPSDPHHDMIILLTRDNYCRPHKHLISGDVQHVIEGRAAIVLFDDDGCVESANVLDVGDVFRIGLGIFHAILPISDRTIFHESRMGPFDKGADTEFPDWAPDDSDTFEATSYSNGLYLELQENHGIYGS